MNYRPTYEDPEYYPDADAGEEDWQDLEVPEDSYCPFETVNS